MEEIGRLAGVHLSLAAVLDGRRQLVRVLAGEPGAVLAAAVPPCRQVSHVAVPAAFDLVVASAGARVGILPQALATSPIVEAG